MARRQRLVFRMSRKCVFDYGMYGEDECETARRHVFMRDSPHWKDITLDTEPEDVSSESEDGLPSWESTWDRAHGMCPHASVVLCKT